MHVCNLIYFQGSVKNGLTMLDIDIEACEAAISESMKVKRILPFRLRRMVGPFISWITRDRCTGVHHPIPYFLNMGNILRISSGVGCLPYSHISNVSTNFAAADLPGPYH
jgi:hypothetical protein